MDDVGFLEYETSRDLFTKLEYEFELLQKEESSYNYLNFCFTAFHLSEWIQADDNFSDKEKNAANNLLHANNINLFEDLTNRGKHYKLTRKRKTVTKDEFFPGFDFNNIDFSKWNFGPDAYLVEQDGIGIDIKEACAKIYRAYKDIYK